VPTPGLNLTRHQLDTVHIHPDSISRTLTKAALPAKMRIAVDQWHGLTTGKGRASADYSLQLAMGLTNFASLRCAKDTGLPLRCCATS
jgi:hypothetical protein